MRAVIFSGGDIYDMTALDIRKDDFVICADAGARHLKAAGITPNLIIGDFDTSADVSDCVQRIRFPSEKDETDTRLAVDCAISKGYENILIFGALGGRADHSFANLLLLKYMYDKNVLGELFDGKNRIFIKDKGFTVSEKEGYVSLFSFFSDVEGLTVEGMKYQLEDYTLTQGDPLCISNEVVSDCASVSFKKGLLIVMMCRD